MSSQSSDSLVRCPRCAAQMPPSALPRHLWDAHQLLLIGRRLSEPWSAIRLRVAEYDATGDADLLAACFELARFTDLNHGETRLERMLRARSRMDDLEAAAASRGASLCPACFALTAVRDRVAVAPVLVVPGRISSRGYVVHVSERGWRPWLTVETPKQVLHRGPEPGQGMTPRGRLWLASGPPVLAALLLALGFVALERDGSGPVVLLLGLAVVLAAFVRGQTKAGPGATERAVDHAWTLLAKRLGAEPTPADAAFLAGLARVSVGRGRPEARAPTLHQCVSQVERELADDAAWLDCAPPLWRLTAEDARRQGRDAVEWLARLCSRCIDGALPAEAAEAALRNWNPDWLTPGARGRLRVLVCERTFDADLEVADLLAGAERAPALGDLLGAAADLAQLRLLWALRIDRPWDRCGDAFTAFEVADQGGPLLDRIPDLLLHHTVTKWPPQPTTGPLAVAVCTRGVLFQDTLFTTAPDAIEVRERGGGFEMSLGPCEFAFRDDPTDLARLLERWFAFYFQEFLPRSAATLKKPGLRTWPPAPRRERTVCPECRERFVPEAGAVGRASPEPAARRSLVP